MLKNFKEFWHSIAYTRSLHFKSCSHEKRIFSLHHPVSATSSKYTLPHHSPLTRGGCVAVYEERSGEGDTRRGFARTFRHVLERLRVPRLNKPLHFLAFQRRRRFSLPQVSRRVVGKDSNPLSPLSSSLRSLARASAERRRRLRPSYSLFTR